MAIELTDEELSGIVGGVMVNGVEYPTKDVQVPLGSCLSLEAEKYYNSMNELLYLNPKYQSDPNYVQAGAWITLFDRAGWPDKFLF